MRHGRLLVWGGLFAVGIACQGIVALSVPHWLSIIACGVVVAVAAVTRGRRADPIIALVIVAWGGWWCALADTRLDDGLHRFIDSGPVMVHGVVVGHPESLGNRTYVVVAMRKVAKDGDEVRAGTRLRLTVLDGPPLKYGDVVEVRAELRRPDPATNPGEFDYRRWLQRQGITAIAFVQYARHLTVLGSEPPSRLMYAAAVAREWVRTGLAGALSPEGASLASAMVVGDRRPLSADVEEQFRRAGVTHLLSVSGLHVGFFAAVAWWLFGTVRLPPAVRAACVIIVAWLYVLATGARPPAVRAGTMTTSTLVAFASGRGRDAPTALTAGALVLLVQNPSLLFDPSFQLSFAATAAIVWWLEPLRRWFSWLPRPVATGCALTTAAQLGVMPLLVGTFQQVSVVGLIGSLIGSPIVSLLVPLGAVVGFVYHVAPLVGTWLGSVLDMLVHILMVIVKHLAALPWALIDVPPPSPALAAAWWLSWWLLLQRGMALRHRRRMAMVAIALIVVSLWAPLLRALPAAELQVIMLDVGQGDAIFVRTPDGVTALIDGGGNIFAGDAGASNPGETVILPYLRYNGIGVVDVVVNTHPHEDHLQGLLPVLQDRRVALAVDGGQEAAGPSWRAYVQVVEERGIARWIAAHGNVIRLGRQTVLEVLHPAAFLSDTRSDLNNNSVVLRLVHGDTALLLTGDIEAEAQLELLRRGAELRAQIVKVPHHGSRWALVSAFYEAVGADIAVITVGRNNYGHPSSEVIDTLEAMGTRVYRTDEDGAVVLTSNGSRWTVRTTVSYGRFCRNGLGRCGNVGRETMWTWRIR